MSPSALQKPHSIACIGPEVVAAGVQVLKALSAAAGFEIDFTDNG